MELISNPLSNELFWPVTLRLLSILAAGFVLVALFNIRNLAGMFQSETGRRYLGWVFMAPAFMTSIFSGGLVAVGFVAFLMMVATREYARMLNMPLFQLHLLWLTGLVSLAVVVWLPAHALLLPGMYFLLILLAHVLRNRLEFAFEGAGATLFGAMWINFALAHFVLFRQMHNGAALLILVGFSVALSDVMAFCVGKLLARFDIGTSHPIASRMSPNKTWAGITGNLLGAITGALVFASIIPRMSLATLLLFGVLIAFGAVLGDLGESMVKRHSNVKDSARSIPGHGGLLDRIDSLLVVIVVSFYFAQNVAA